MLNSSTSVDNIISWISLDSKMKATSTIQDEKFDRLYLI